MNLDLRMDLADCGSPEKILEVVFRYYPDLPRCVPVHEIATDVGIIDFKVLEVDGFIGGLTADPEKNRGIILTKEGLPRKRQRFTIGHELGHFLIPTHGHQRLCTRRDLEENSRATNYQRQETEANRFSAGLLMPKPLFVKDIDALGSADVAHVRELSNRYDVSMEAVANRYLDFTAENCAFIFSRENIARYARTCRDFPKLAIEKGGTLPQNSLTRRVNVVGVPSNWAEHDGNIWLETTWGKRLPTVLEQAIAQSNGFKVTLLFIDRNEQDSIEDEEDIEAGWRPKFR